MILIACGLVLGCHAEVREAAPAAPGNEGNALLASVMAVQHRMHVRFSAAGAMLQAIERGDLDATHTSAGVLAATAEPAALPAWQPYFESIERAAQDVESAGNLSAAASAGALLGMRCASCHMAIKARIQFASEPRPPDEPRLAQQMQGHQWAATQMWEGLIGPSDERWMAGAQALLTVPLGIVAQSGISGFPDDVDDEARVRMLGRRALTAGPNSARADVFGDLLASCAHCHAVLRDR
jgi:hypothetical protein